MLTKAYKTQKGSPSSIVSSFIIVVALWRPQYNPYEVVLYFIASLSPLDFITHNLYEIMG